MLYLSVKMSINSKVNISYQNWTLSWKTRFLSHELLHCAVIEMIRSVWFQTFPACFQWKTKWASGKSRVALLTLVIMKQSSLSTVKIQKTTGKAWQMSRSNLVPSLFLCDHQFILFYLFIFRNVYDLCKRFHSFCTSLSSINSILFHLNWEKKTYADC